MPQVRLDEDGARVERVCGQLNERANLVAASRNLRPLRGTRSLRDGLIVAPCLVEQLHFDRIEVMGKAGWEYWIDLARYDLRTAKALQKANRRLYVGFLCHLVIEKTLKAYWVQVKKSIPPFTHDLSLLAEKTGVLEAMDERTMLVMDFLEPLYLEGRYPTEKSRLLRVLTVKRCDWLIKETQRAHRWIAKMLPKR
jgi:HEPN domain-containing protein